MFKVFKRGARKRKCKVVTLNVATKAVWFYCRTHRSEWTSPVHGCPKAEV